MFHFLLGLAGVELRSTAQRAATTALLFAVGGFVLLIALGAALFAAFLALADHYDPVTAALLIAGFSLLIAVIVLLVAYMRLRRPVRRRASPFAAFAAPPAPPVAPLGAVPPVMPPPGTPPFSGALDGKTVLGIAAGAALIGLILGRRI